MTPTEVYEALDQAFPGDIESGPLGVALKHAGSVVLRLERGSGIAGRGDVWSITFPGSPDAAPIVGLRTKATLFHALRGLTLRVFHDGEWIDLTMAVRK